MMADLPPLAARPKHIVKLDAFQIGILIDMVYTRRDIYPREGYDWNVFDGILDQLTEATKQFDSKKEDH